jgi:DNA processing protein
MRATHTIVEPLAQDGIVILSGLAYGIDAEAHLSTLRVQGTTVAILGNAIDRVYPAANLAIAHEILDKGGSLVSEYPPGTQTQRHFFPQRNRILAGMSLATLIVEAGSTSGALITASMALDENRDVFAVPGPLGAEKSEGTNTLIKQGAGLVTCADDLRSALGLDSLRALPETKQMYDLTEDERTLVSLLDAVRHVDELVALSTLDARAVTTAMGVLELKGYVRHLGGMHYIRN